MNQVDVGVRNRPRTRRAGIYRCIDVCMLCLRNSAIIFIINFTIHYYGSARKVHATPKEESHNRYFFRLKVFILSSLKPLIYSFELNQYKRL